MVATRHRSEFLPALPKARRWTYAEYAKLPNDGKRYQILDGELHVSPAPSLLHQDIVGNLYALLLAHVRRRRLGRVFVSPVDVVLDRTDVVQPDVVFVSRRRRRVLTTANVQGAPDLAVEVLSPSTARLDRVRKLDAYAKFGVAHYWIIDSETKQLEELVLAQGVYRPKALVERDDGVFRPALFPGLKIRLGDLWK